MDAARVISIDVGSTYTKGVLFAVEANALRVLQRSDVPTTLDLSEGFTKVLNRLLSRPVDAPLTPAGIPVRFSSSAKGGLRIAAIGLVPDLTVKVARLAACSAGGKVVRAYAYGLTETSIAELEALAPDIVLVTGGTDGGNRDRVLENVNRLAGARLASTIIYAGNRELADDVRRLLAGKPLRVTSNVMPEMDTLDLEPARLEIRRTFLDTIVNGKGLSEIVRIVGADPKPTPLAVFELVETLAARRPGWRDFLVVDMGGATTDVYSHTEPFAGEPATVLRGVREPVLKRSVEGDLGLRVSVLTLVDAAREGLSAELAVSGEGDLAGLETFAKQAAAQTDLLPRTPIEKRYDDLLARACLRESVARHAGVLRAAWTPTGQIGVQYGKDLRRIQTIVGTGGYLSRKRPFAPSFAGATAASTAAPLQDGEETRLLPVQFTYKLDAAYLWPLLGNLAAEYPEAAVGLAEQCLESA